MNYKLFKTIDKQFVMQQQGRTSNIMSDIGFDRFDKHEIKRQIKERMFRQYRPRSTIVNVLGSYFWKIHMRDTPEFDKICEKFIFGHGHNLLLLIHFFMIESELENGF